VWRRRACDGCQRRFTTYERVEHALPMVVKKDGQREPFDRDKLLRSMQIALRKRPVDPERLERVVNGIVRRLESSGESEIPTTVIGQIVMDALANLDQVAYVRERLYLTDLAGNFALGGLNDSQARVSMRRFMEQVAQKT
jgi:transcriptional repressor NrdR